MLNLTTSRRALACVLALTAAPVFAQEEIADDTGRSLVEEIVVTGERHSSPTALSVEDARRQLSRISGAVDLVTQEAFLDEYAENLGEMLNLTPGVIAQERYAEEIRLSIRGSGLSRNFHLRGVELLLDGTPINFADGSADFQEIDARLTRYLEVYKGGNGFDYGAATLGGAINVVSPTGRSARSPYSLSIEGGSFETVKLTGTLAQQSENYDFFIGATGVHSNQYRDHSTQVNGRVTANVGLKVSDDVETRFYIIANHINQEIPGSLSLDDALDNRRQAVPNNITNDWARDIRSLRLINKTAIDLGENGQLLLGAYGTLRDLDHPIFVFIDDETTDYGLFGRYENSFEIGGLRNEFTAGFMARRSNTDDDWFVNVGGKRGFQIQSTDQKAGQIQGYITNQLFLTDNLALDLGVQAYATKRDFEDNFNPTRNDVANFEAVNPKIGVLWDVNETAQVWANVTRAKEPPTFSELIQRAISQQFVALNAQDAWTAEIGTRGVYGPVAWDVTVFRAWIDDELLQFSVDGGNTSATLNADDTVHQGLEAGLHVTLSDNVTTQVAYTYSDFKFDDDATYGDNQLPTSFRHFFNGEVRYEEEGRFHIAFTYQWAPKAPWVDYTNSLRATDFAVFGISGGVQLAAGVSLYADVQNITDKRYVSTFSTVLDATLANANLNVFTPGDGIGAFGGLRVEF